MTTRQLYYAVRQAMRGAASTVRYQHDAELERSDYRAILRYCAGQAGRPLPVRVADAALGAGWHAPLRPDELRVGCDCGWLR